MKNEKYMRQVDAIGKEIVDFLNRCQFPLELLPAALCNVYCSVSSEAGVSPDVFIRSTMTIFAEYSGGEMVFVSSDDLEGAKERDGATLQ